MAHTTLLIGAQPVDVAGAGVYDEVEAIRDCLRGSEAFHVEVVLKSTRQRVLEAMVRHRPSVVHFCGHGWPDEGLVFEDEAGTAMAVDPRVLAEFFSEFRDHLVCVVLNACFSEVQAAAIAEHVPFVVGTEGRLQVADAIEYSRAFYRVLAEDEDVQRAHRLGRNALSWGAREATRTASTELFRGPSDLKLRLRSPATAEGDDGPSGARRSAPARRLVLGLAGGILALWVVFWWQGRARPAPGIEQFYVSVLGVDGFPTDRATLQVNPGEALRTAGGWLVRLPPEAFRGQVRLDAHVDGEPLRASEIVDLATWQGTSFDLRLERLDVGVRGVVVDMQGRPVEGAQVSVVGSTSVTTDDEGVFEIRDTGRAVGDPVQLRAIKDGYLPREQVHPAGARPARLVLEIDGS